MKILVVGGGGREHALVWKIAQSPLVKKIYAAPGNPGISQSAECLDIKATDIPIILNFALKEKIDLTVVGPEAPLVAGIVNEFRSAGLKIFGPTAEAAELEGSKVFCKDLLRKNNIPSAAYKTFQDTASARDYLKTLPSYPVVLKADGLAAGKGVVICPDAKTADETVREMMEKKVFGPAGNKIVVEEFLTGEEVSVLAITDGQTIIVLEPSQDHKKAFDNNQGPNTGGMGAYSPVPFVTQELMNRIIREILVPTVHAMKRANRPYQGVLYAGLILTATGPKVLEFNVRFGDPETQPLMMRLKSDLVPLLLAAADKRLDKIDTEPEWFPQASVCVVMASGGYPGSYQSGLPISGLVPITSGLDKIKRNEAMIFHAGTAWRDAETVTAGGRVLGVTALGKTISEARQKAYETVGQISWEGAFYRKDIGLRACPVSR